MMFFTRIDPAKKISRFWLVRVTRTMFGEWSLLREWGRIGSPGTVQARTFESEKEARRAEQQGVNKRVRRGYAETQDVVVRWSQVLAAGGSIHAAEKGAKIRAKTRDYLANDKQGNLDF